MAVFRPSSARSAGLSRAGVHAELHRLAALVLLRPRARRAASGWFTRSRRKHFRNFPEPCPLTRVGTKWWTAFVKPDWTRKRVAMQYSPNCAVPYVAMVDAGTIELIRGLGVEVVTSANLVQYFEARWSKEQLE